MKPIAHSSEFQRLQRLTAALAIDQESAPQTQKPNYLRFPAPTQETRPEKKNDTARIEVIKEVEVVREIEVVKEVPVYQPHQEPDPPEDALTTWEEVLIWCVESSSAHLAFLVDNQGFIVAHQCEWTFDVLEDMGSQLIVAMSRADETDVGGKARTLAVEYDDFWLTGMRFGLLSDEELTLVLGSYTPLPLTAAKTIAQYAQQALS